MQFSCCCYLIEKGLEKQMIRKELMVNACVIDRLLDILA